MKEAVEQYISKALGQTLLLTPMPVGTALPMFYTSQYDFCSGVLSGVEYVFCFEKEGKRTTPLNIRKRLAFLTGHFQREVVYCADALEFHATQQMMTYGIPFIVPGKALFLPFLAVALKSTMRRRLMDWESFSTYACGFGRASAQAAASPLHPRGGADIWLFASQCRLCPQGTGAVWLGEKADQAEGRRLGVPL